MLEASWILRFLVRLLHRIIVTATTSADFQSTIEVDKRDWWRVVTAFTSAEFQSALKAHKHLFCVCVIYVIHI